MPQENSAPSYASQAFLTNAYEQLKKFKSLSHNNICTLTQNFLKIVKTFKCVLFTGNNKAFKGLIELYDEAIKKIP
ncbi:hypothetical protein [Rickettsia australis]|uniref:Uncharacterized protein n=1 Tax=Rickettsia australis (strain Cutlack) TaxID=1105110 RepID=H8K7E5_RICAC|nr:hypothetical protein [Rickettsia australis]AFC71188.1 hypothetical protein MC5_04400 [Rickettsia australis str. Cutlack]